MDERSDDRFIELNRATDGIKDECISVGVGLTAKRDILQHEFLTFAGVTYRQTEIGSGVFLSIHPYDLGAK